MRELEDKYIELLLKRCLNLDKSNGLLISIDLKEHMPIALNAKEKAIEMGVKDVVIYQSDLDEYYDYLKNTPLEDIELNPLLDKSLRNEYAKKGAAILFFMSSIPGLMSDIEIEKINKANKLAVSTMTYYRENVSSYTFPWTIACLPNERWAKQIFSNDENAYKKLYLKIMEMCMITHDDPIKSWEEFIKRSNEYKEKLNSLEITSLHYKNSLGTDLTIGKRKDAQWMNLDKTTVNGTKLIVNMPSYEIFTSPDYRLTEGIVYASKPLIYSGNIIDKFWLEFKEGKIINYGALVGEKYLGNLINEDPNCCYLGEVALVEHNSPISNTNLVYNNTLFDENASCHLALGRGFKLVLPNGNNMSDEELRKKGINLSLAHTDFMIGTSDLEIEAETNIGRKLIFKNGNFNI